MLWLLNITVSVRRYSTYFGYEIKNSLYLELKITLSESRVLTAASTYGVIIIIFISGGNLSLSI